MSILITALSMGHRHAKMMLSVFRKIRKRDTDAFAMKGSRDRIVCRILMNVGAKMHAFMALVRIFMALISKWSMFTVRSELELK